MKPTLLDAAINLVPNAQVSLDDSTLIWHKPETCPVSSEVLQAEYDRLLVEYAKTDYQRLRAAEYPPVADYLDGVVKGDQAQINKYIADCLAVKAKYPKPLD